MTAGAPALVVTLRQTLALLEGERQALAALDLDRIHTCTSGKLALCDRLEAQDAAMLDEECRALLETVKHRNEVNRRMRNLLAASIEGRLATLTGVDPAYCASSRPAGARLGA